MLEGFEMDNLQAGPVRGPKGAADVYRRGDERKVSWSWRESDGTIMHSVEPLGSKLDTVGAFRYAVRGVGLATAATAHTGEVVVALDRLSSEIDRMPSTSEAMEAVRNWATSSGRSASAGLNEVKRVQRALRLIDKRAGDLATGLREYGQFGVPERDFAALAEAIWSDLLRGGTVDLGFCPPVGDALVGLSEAVEAARVSHEGVATFEALPSRVATEMTGPWAALDTRAEAEPSPGM